MIEGLMNLQIKNLQILCKWGFYPRPECAVEVAMRLESPTAVLTPQRKLELLLYI